MNISSVMRIIASVAAAALATIGVSKIMKDGAEVLQKHNKVTELMGVVKQQDAFIKANNQ